MSTRAQVKAAIITRINAMTFNTPINGATTWKTGPQDSVNPSAPARLRLWENVATDQQPAAFLVTHRERDEYRNLGLVRRRYEFGVWCYSRSDNAPGGPDLDTMMEAFEVQFGPAAADNNSTNQLTLGGLVYWCRIEGQVFKDPGDIDNQTLLIMPLLVEVP